MKSTDSRRWRLRNRVVGVVIAAWLALPAARAALVISDVTLIDGTGAPARPHTTVVMENVRRLHDGGVTIALASDRSEASLTHREMELLADAGIPAADIITLATRNGAVFLGKAHELGTVEPGKRADLVLLDADPTQDIRNVRKIAAVIKDGQWIERALLDLPVNRRPRAGDAP